MNDAKRRALVAITREALGMPEQPSTCCPPERSAGTAEQEKGCCSAPPETALEKTTKPGSENSSAKCCTP